jgi:hypothetical protein
MMVWGPLLGHDSVLGCNMRKGWRIRISGEACGCSPRRAKPGRLTGRESWKVQVESRISSISHHGVETHLCVWVN